LISAATLDPHGVAVLVLAAAAFVSFAVGRVQLETTSIVIIAVLVLGFFLFPYRRDGVPVTPADFLLGFGHQALVTICALMVLGKALATTGALEPVGRVLGSAMAARPRIALLAVLVFCAAASGVVNDTPIVVIMLPVLMSAALRSNSTPTATLTPMNYAVLVGGMGTTIGTSTNLLVVSIAADLGVRRFGIFEFLPLAALAAVPALLYLWLVLPRLIPERSPPIGDASPQLFSAVLSVKEDGSAHDQPFAEVLKKGGSGVRIEKLERNGMELVRLPTVVVRAGDRLYVRASAKGVREFADSIGASLHNVGDLDQIIDDEHPLAKPDQRLAEVVVTERSPLDNATLRETRFADFHDVIIVGLQRAGAGALQRAQDVGDARLRTGDVLLVQGGAEEIAKLRQSAGLLVLDTSYEIPHTAKAPLTLVIVAAVVVGAATKIVPIYVAALLGVALMVITRCIDWEEATHALSAKVILLIAASLALSAALTRTGGTDFLAASFLQVTQALDRQWLLPLLMLLMAGITNFISNSAAAAVGTPVAVSIAAQLGLSPEPLVLAVLFGANFCYLTPMAYQTNLLVMAAGAYRFLDFVRGGAPLLVIMLVAYSILLPRFFPF
jgi:di/tricarboxylate transporter